MVGGFMAHPDQRFQMSSTCAPAKCSEARECPQESEEETGAGRGVDVEHKVNKGQTSKTRTPSARYLLCSSLRLRCSSFRTGERSHDRAVRSYRVDTKTGRSHRNSRIGTNQRWVSLDRMRRWAVQI